MAVGKTADFPYLCIDFQQPPAWAIKLTGKINPMNKYILNLLLLLTTLVLSSASSCSHDDDGPDTPDAPPATVSRTVLVYMVADNTLGTNFGSDDEDITEMLEGVKGGALNGGRLIVYHNRPKTAQGNPPQMLEITEQGLKVLKTYPDDASIYSVDPARIREVMADMKRLAPAEDYGLVLWSHANGWLGPTSPSDDRYRAFGDDRGYHITVQTLAKTLEGEQFSFIYFDCCLMGCVEVIYEMRGLTPCIVASPTELSIDGMPYDRNVPEMFLAEPDVVQMAENTYKYYEDDVNGYDEGCQIAVYDTRTLDALAAATRDILVNVKEFPEMVDYIQRYNRPYEATYIYDMDNYMELIARVDYPEQLEAWRKAWRNTVVYGAATRNGIGGLYFDRYCGLGVMAIDSHAEATWRGYNTLQWWKDVASVAPVFKAADPK